MKYNIVITFNGNATERVIESENNEDAKRLTKEMMKEIGIPKGKYAIISVIKDEDKKVIVDDLWCLN